MRVLLFCSLILCSASVLAQHTLQVDNGAGAYSTIIGPTPGGAFTLPPGGGMLVVVPPPGTPALAWLTAGNTLAGGSSSTPNELFGSVNNYDVIMVANNLEKMRLVAGGGVNVTGQFQAVQTGTANAAIFQISNAASVSSVVSTSSNGIGSGIAVQLTNISNGSRGIDVAQSGVGTGVYATSAGGNGVWGISSSISSAGVRGENTFGEAVVGHNRAANGVGAVVGRNDSTGSGVYGFNTKDGFGVLGRAGISGGNGTAGRFENVSAANINSTVAVATNGIGNGITVDLSNASNNSRGIDVDQSGAGPGVYATSAGGNGVWGISSSVSSAGVMGDNTFGEAVVGRNRSGVGVGAVVGRNDASGCGVRGFNTSNGCGVLGQAGIAGGTGIAGRFENVNAANTSDVLQVVTNSAGNAARFTGNVVITGDLTVSGTIAKGGGSFKIDHPLDPKNKVLFHSFVESPDMKNINDGIVTLDHTGSAVVTLPNWFEALNADFRYQLTPIGGSAPGLYVSQEVKDNTFAVSGGKPGMKVSWQVTGIRHDAYAKAHRIQVEVDKTADERGTYIHPDVYGVAQQVVVSSPTVTLSSSVSATPDINLLRKANNENTSVAKKSESLKLSSDEKASTIAPKSLK